MKYLNNQAMGTAVKEAISLCGIKVLADTNKFQAAIRDFLPGSLLKNERHLLVFSIEIGVGRRLLETVNKPISDQKRTLWIVDSLLTVEYGFMDIRSKEILHAFMLALGWPLRLLLNDENTFSKSYLLGTTTDKFTKNTIVTFGKYSWLVLHVTNNAALLVTKNITDIGIPYNKAENIEKTTWETCSLREWLNTEFLQRFSEEEVGKIVESEIKEENPWPHTSGGYQTKDKVFLLSVSEVIRYFGDSGFFNKGAVSTEVCTINDEFNLDRQAAYKTENTWWWLRSPGDSNNKVAYINAEGVINLNGEVAFDDGGFSCVGVRPGVRPAIWLSKTVWEV
ncbi:hypothetical protein JZO70_09055 [Enterococcus sp. 669A]|uniref:DUF6273 domain-containing protein n=1 Tax=Candidatus Enterococcus moelleringii TaxID=2815325 RepID=A0ABS3L9L2_9ENTE|nr:DUF6273 domain-containing protein [Enterococcus sp. 669A]MBO1306307.1 hypothetical protein [Enterococcus sp. 669A]